MTLEGSLTKWLRIDGQLLDLKDKGDLFTCKNKQKTPTDYRNLYIIDHSVICCVRPRFENTCTILSLKINHSYYSYICATFFFLLLMLQLNSQREGEIRFHTNFPLHHNESVFWFYVKTPSCWVACRAPFHCLWTPAALAVRAGTGTDCEWLGLVEDERHIVTGWREGGEICSCSSGLSSAEAHQLR